MPNPHSSSSRRLPPDAELLLRGTPADILGRIADGDPLQLRARVAASLERRCLLLDADRCLLLTIADVARCAGHWGGRPALGRWLGERVDAALDQALVEEARLLGDWSAGSPALAAPRRGTVAEPPAAYGQGLPELPPVDGEHAALVIPALDPADRSEDWTASLVHEEEPRPEGSGATGAGQVSGAPAVPVLAALARPLGLDVEGLRRACAAFNARPEPERRAFDALVLGRQSLDEVAQVFGCSGSAVGRRARRVLDAILAAVVVLPDGGVLPASTGASNRATTEFIPPDSPSQPRP